MSTPNVTNVTVSTHVKPTTKSQIIVVKNVITGGSGNLEEVIQGGDIRYSLTLTKGHELRRLEKGEDVWVKGTNADGEEFALSISLKVGTTHRPWTFGGDNGGSTGPSGPGSTASTGTGST